MNKRHCLRPFGNAVDNGAKKRITWKVSEKGILTQPTIGSYDAIAICCKILMNGCFFVHAAGKMVGLDIRERVNFQAIK